ncbi:MAG TPA: hypothetical protein VK063_04855 [Beutenbergiaceae bacterium]|nr:hypothetical protein [Beutenbergiaceae bacterium]
MSHATACTHCGEHGEHDHVDSREHARSRRRQLALVVIARVLIVLLAGTLVLLTAQEPVAGIWALVAGLAAWALSTGIGVGASALWMPAVGRTAALMRGALAAAALVPVMAVATTRLGISSAMDGWQYAALVGTGYLAGAFGAECVRLWQLRALLGQDTREGEVARDSAAITHQQDQDALDLLATALTGGLVALYVWLTGMLWPLVLVLVPLHVAVVALRRRAGVRRARAGRSVKIDA